MKCPYNDFECDYIDTSGESVLLECYECCYFNKGVKATGSVSKWIEKMLIWIGFKERGFKS
jgi:hypothetical protein